MDNFSRTIRSKGVGKGLVAAAIATTAVTLMVILATTTLSSRAVTADDDDAQRESEFARLEDEQAAADARALEARRLAAAEALAKSEVVHIREKPRGLASTREIGRRIGV